MSRRESVIHDWSDERAGTILRNCRRAMKDDGQLLRVERDLPEGSDPSVGKLLDVFMLVFEDGCERRARSFDAAIEEEHNALALEPTFFVAYRGIGYAAAAAGRYQEAVAALQQGRTHAHGDLMLEGFLGCAYALAGQREEALEIVDQLEQRRGEGHSAPLACVYAGLGEHDQAIEWLERAREKRDGALTYLAVLACFDPLRSDPRFQDLLRRMNFPH